MIKLQYTQEEYLWNIWLKNAVQDLLWLAARHRKEGHNIIVFDENGYVPPIDIYDYIIEYKSIIKMPKQYYTKNVETTKWPNFDNPTESKDWLFVYVPSDFTGESYTWLELKTFVDNWCEIITISEYLEWYNIEYPPLQDDI